MDILAEDAGVASEGRLVVKVTPVTSVEGPDTGLWTAKDEVTQEAHIFKFIYMLSRRG